MSSLLFLFLLTPSARGTRCRRAVNNKATTTTRRMTAKMRLNLRKLTSKFEIIPVHAHAGRDFERGDKEGRAKRKGGVRRDDGRQWALFVSRLLLYLILNSKEELIDP